MSFGGGSSGGQQTTTQSVQPYAAAQPALNQIISEAGQLYNQGVGAAGFVPPTQQTLQGLATQETMANAANQQLAATLGGQYLNPFLKELTYPASILSILALVVVSMATPKPNKENLEPFFKS